ncbi:hypothetical protein JHK87_007558 [Glycine soja]|nr:hypothetical protein JHK87_007558 [Glycine soja]
MQGGGSFRIGSSSIWRDSDANIFSNSFHQEDDEEALKWAAIQKLPTVARLRKALLTSSEGEVVGIDLPTIEVRFENSNIEAESHVGTRALPTFTNFMIHIVEQCVHILKGIAVISLLQPAPETYNLFDDIILLSDSHIVYQGPREYVLQFFESIGFKCPERKGVADFLQEVGISVFPLDNFIG